MKTFTTDDKISQIEINDIELIYESIHKVKINEKDYDLSIYKKDTKEEFPISYCFYDYDKYYILSSIVDDTLYLKIDLIGLNINSNYTVIFDMYNSIVELNNDNIQHQEFSCSSNYDSQDESRNYLFIPLMKFPIGCCINKVFHISELVNFNEIKMEDYIPDFTPTNDITSFLMKSGNDTLSLKKDSVWDYKLNTEIDVPIPENTEKIIDGNNSTFNRVYPWKIIIGDNSKLTLNNITIINYYDSTAFSLGQNSELILNDCQMISYGEGETYFIDQTSEYTLEEFTISNIRPMEIVGLGDPINLSDPKYCKRRFNTDIYSNQKDFHLDIENPNILTCPSTNTEPATRTYNIGPNDDGYKPLMVLKNIDWFNRTNNPGCGSLADYQNIIDNKMGVITSIDFFIDVRPENCQKFIKMYFFFDHLLNTEQYAADPYISDDRSLHMDLSDLYPYERSQMNLLYSRLKLSQYNHLKTRMPFNCDIGTFVNQYHQWYIGLTLASDFSYKNLRMNINGYNVKTDEYNDDLLPYSESTMLHLDFKDATGTLKVQNLGLTDFSEKEIQYKIKIGQTFITKTIPIKSKTIETHDIITLDNESCKIFFGDQTLNGLKYEFVGTGDVNVAGEVETIHGNPKSYEIGDWFGYRAFEGFPLNVCDISFSNTFLNGYNNVGDHFFAFAFKNSTIVEITNNFKIPTNFDKIGENFFNGTFESCHKLELISKYITFDKTKNYGDYHFAYMFYDFGTNFKIPSDSQMKFPPKKINEHDLEQIFVSNHNFGDMQFNYIINSYFAGKSVESMITGFWNDRTTWSNNDNFGNARATLIVKDTDNKPVSNKLVIINEDSANATIIVKDTNNNPVVNKLITIKEDRPNWGDSSGAFAPYNENYFKPIAYFIEPIFEDNFVSSYGGQWNHWITINRFNELMSIRIKIGACYWRYNPPTNISLRPIRSLYHVQPSNDIARGDNFEYPPNEMIHFAKLYSLLPDVDQRMGETIFKDSGMWNYGNDPVVYNGKYENVGEYTSGRLRLFIMNNASIGDGIDWNIPSDFKEIWVKRRQFKNDPVKRAEYHVNGENYGDFIQTQSNQLDFKIK